jgi:hypothetical protein
MTNGINLTGNCHNLSVDKVPLLQKCLLDLFTGYCTFSSECAFLILMVIPLTFYAFTQPHE